MSGQLTAVAVDITELTRVGLTVSTQAVLEQYFHGIVRSVEGNSVKIAVLPGSIVGEDEDGRRVTDYLGNRLIPGQAYALNTRGGWVASNANAVGVAASEFAMRIAFVAAVAEPTALRIAGLHAVSAQRGGQIAINELVSGGTAPYTFTLRYEDGTEVPAGTSVPATNIAFDAATQTIHISNQGDTCSPVPFTVNRNRYSRCICISFLLLEHPRVSLLRSRFHPALCGLPKQANPYI